MATELTSERLNEMREYAQETIDHIGDCQTMEAQRQAKLAGDVILLLKVIRLLEIQAFLAPGTWLEKFNKMGIIEELLRLDAEATPGPWNNDWNSAVVMCGIEDVCEVNDLADAPFIVFLRNHAPALARKYRDLLADRRALLSKIEELEHKCRERESEIETLQDMMEDD